MLKTIVACLNIVTLLACYRHLSLIKHQKTRINDNSLDSQMLLYQTTSSSLNIVLIERKSIGQNLPRKETVNQYVSFTRGLLNQQLERRQE